ncbi:LOW QUALITY PROTEIN: hypothetical protein OSB04_015086 [Centaurea solstitialis]|uniref:PPM-type phosphatase domain-containing protein n=1 Tax=Centaurea solstitialis TaxID=347529 RepID=A0AA38TBQ3_9ASTR|nr:LOW QUALITY PROTEIN: hypothetical protein OSB04_015086 [Centaurea solstitialis]
MVAVLVVVTVVVVARDGSRRRRESPEKGVAGRESQESDRSLHPFVIPVPDIRFIERAMDDECVIIASDGLIHSDEAARIATQVLRRRRGKGSKSAAEVAATYLMKHAIKRSNRDNISVIVVDLKSPQSNAAATSAAIFEPLSARVQRTWVASLAASSLLTVSHKPSEAIVTHSPSIDLSTNHTSGTEITQGRRLRPPKKIEALPSVHSHNASSPNNGTFHNIRARRFGQPRGIAGNPILETFSLPLTESLPNPPRADVPTTMRYPRQFLGRSPSAKACSPGSKPPYLQNASPRARTQVTFLGVWVESHTIRVRIPQVTFLRYPDFGSGSLGQVRARISGPTAVSSHRHYRFDLKPVRFKPVIRSNRIGSNPVKIRLHPWDIPIPDVRFVDREMDDECVIIATDGVGYGNDPRPGRGSKIATGVAAAYLMKLAIKRHISDNISVIVVDLKSPQPMF